jgi:hypothetical protein
LCIQTDVVESVFDKDVEEDEEEQQLLLLPAYDEECPEESVPDSPSDSHTLSDRLLFFFCIEGMDLKVHK